MWAAYAAVFLFPGSHYRQAVSFWERMAAAGKNNPSPPEILSTYPGGATRIENIKSLMPEAMQFYNAA